MSPRVRFAPSNTGYLHMGGVRTALFNYLFARHHDGTFVLRVEDTDPERSKAMFTDAILDAMSWLGMHADEGPFFQSQRLDLYRQKVDELMAKGLAYKCFSTPEELERERERAIREGTKTSYSRIWRDRTDHPENKPYVVRIKMPLEGSITINDMVQGEVTVDVEELDDFIILRSDGSPTYNFVVVVDDATMGITHVIRGKDHLNNTFRQIPVYRALGFEPPQFGHLPLVAGLSKRKGSMSVQAYRERGFLHEAVANYVARLGWSHGDQEIFTLDELIEYFDFDHVGKSSGAFDDTKFEWVNFEWMKRLDDAELAGRWVPFLAKLGFEVEVDDRLIGVVSIMKERAKTLVEMAEQAAYFFADDIEIEEKAGKKWLKPGLVAVFEELIGRLSELDVWDNASIEEVFRDMCARHDIGLGKIAQPTRVSVTGGTASPGLFDTLRYIGQQRSIERMKGGLAVMQARAEAMGNG